MSKKKIIEITGKEETFEPTTLDEIMGFNQMSRYNTLSLEDYQKKLDEMNRADLEQEARYVGAIIVESTERLRANLVKEFNSYINSLRRPKHISKPITISKEVEKILKEGR
jgi:hypothetical protein